MKKVALFIVSILLLSACGKKKNSFESGEANKMQLDESKIVLHSSPKNLTSINDSTLAMICNRQCISLVDLKSGKMTRMYSPQSIRLDSLLDVTYNVYYKGKRRFIFDSTSTQGLQDATLQVQTFSRDQQNYYVYLNGEVEVKYENDTVARNKDLSDPRVKEVLKKDPNTNFYFMEYVQFMFVLNSELELQKIIPIYDPSTPDKKNTYSYQLGFGAYQGSFYVPLLPSNWTAANYRSKVNDNGFFYSMAKQKMDDLNGVELLFSNEVMDYSTFSFTNYLGAQRRFHLSGNTCYFSNGKEVISVDGKDPVIKKGEIKENEWINDFYINDEFVFLKTSAFSPKKNPSKLDVAYAIDSVSAENIVIVDRASAEKQYLPLHLKKVNSFAVAKGQLIFIESDAEHYYVTRIPINES